MTKRRSLLSKKRYGKTNRGAAFIHNMFVDSLRNADKKRKSRLKEQTKDEKEVLEQQARIWVEEQLVDNPDENDSSSVDPVLKAERVSKGRWIAYWFSMGLMFWGIHLMRESTWYWLWFVPMLLPFMGVLQNESEKPLPLGFHCDPTKKPGIAARFFDIWSALIIAIIGVFLMVRSPEEWYLFIPFLILFLLLLPQKMKQWEQEEKDDEIRKIEKKARREEWRETSPLWKILKVIFWIVVLWLLWTWGGFFIFMWVFGLAR